MTPFDLATIVLATYYAAYSVVKLDAPFGAFKWLRTKGDLFNCIYCTSWWVALLWCAVWLTPARALVYPFAIAGGVMFVHKYAGGFIV